MKSDSQANTTSLFIAIALLCGVFLVFGFLPPATSSTTDSSPEATRPASIPLGTGSLRNPADIQSGINTTGQSYSPQQAATLNVSEFNASGLNR